MDMESDTENQPAEVGNQASMFKVCSVPGTPQPLQPLSPERQNQQRLPQSPSLPLHLDGDGSPRKMIQHRLSDASDVKARIAYLNAVSQTSSPTRSNSPTKSNLGGVNHAAIQRAILGREEAETALNALTAQLESAKARERLVSERVESLVEQLSEARNRQRHERAVYEKEMRQSKKSEYKAELAVIKLQEDLKEVRNELDGYKVRNEHDKTEKEKARQEAFERAYVVAGMTEELQDVKRRLEVALQERDAAVALTAVTREVTENQQAVTEESKEDSREVGEKRKRPMLDFDPLQYEESDLHAPDCPIEVKYAAMQKEAHFLRQQVIEGQETIHFMNMQCQFKACPCRMAERNGVRFVHDYEYDAKVRARNAKKRKVEGLEEQLPLPIFTSWRRERLEAQGRQTMHGPPVVEPKDIEPVEHQPGSSPPHQPNSETTVEPVAVVQIPTAPLPPTEVIDKETRDLVDDNGLDEAANIPLPSSKPKGADSNDDTLEPTDQLEELTQVLVEPAHDSTRFLFSSSITGKAVAEPDSTVPQSHNLRMSDDLFDISPPKRHLPPRPSTAMGVLTVESPIRLVPNSPQLHKRRSLTPELDIPHAVTTQVALNDTSPVRQARAERQQARPRFRDQSRGRSPPSKHRARLDRSSPAPSTLFPVTPAPKHERSTQHPAEGAPESQSGADRLTNPSQEISTTTTTKVPLRDDLESAAGPLSDEQTGSTSSSTPFHVPGTPNMTREAALAQIRARRDRARSINMRKSAEEASKTPGSAARRGVNLKDRFGDTKGRDFSQASAPGRI